MDLHGRIMNLTCVPKNMDAEPNQRLAYKIGHRDARHAAAELAAAYEAELDVLRKDADRWRWYITPGERQQQCSRLDGEMLVAAVDTHMAAERAAG